MRVVLPYLLFATAWILLTDWQLLPALLGRSVPDFSWYQTAKGLLFVAATSLFLYLVLGSLLRRLWAAQEAVIKSEARYRRFIEQASDGILIIDWNLHFLEVNEMACSLLGYSREELLACTYTDIISKESLERLPLQLTAIKPGEVLRFERQYCRKDKSEFPADVSMNAIEDGSVQIIIRDATDRKRYESGLIEARQKADEMVRTKDAFLANMSHEIRTPLTAVIGFARLLYDESEGPIREFAELIQNGGRRLLETLNSVLDLAQLRGGSLRLQHQTIDPVHEAQRVVQLFDIQARKKGLELRLEVTPLCPREFATDPGALGRILNNLISNAIKFTHRGHVTVRLDGEPNAVRFEVKDTGIGIGEEYQKHLFEEFSQEATGLARPYEGNGLGLAITRQLVDLLSGEITVRSRPGEGASFVVRLPVQYT